MINHKKKIGSQDPARKQHTLPVERCALSLASVVNLCEFFSLCVLIHNMK